jgi:hypothetical protein
MVKADTAGGMKGRLRPKIKRESSLVLARNGSLFSPKFGNGVALKRRI